MLRRLVPLLAFILVPPAFAQLLPTPPAAVTSGEDAGFTTFRHDLINLLVLQADPRKLAAAAQIAAPDENDPSRMALKKTPGLLKRARQFGPQDRLVLWVSAANACLDKPGCADPQSLKTLQDTDADNAAVWLLSWPEDDDKEKARDLLAHMAQAQRYDDYWAPDVLAIYHALESLPVPANVRAQGIGKEAARINFATGIASALLPAALQRAGKFCAASAADATLAADCLAFARKLEAGGTFVSQSVGFSIDEALLAPGVDRDVMNARKRSAAWQKQQFLELSMRFGHDPALAQSWLRLLDSEGNAIAAVQALMREQQLRTDPPGSWQPPAANGPDPLRDPATPLPLGGQ